MHQRYINHVNHVLQITHTNMLTSSICMWCMTVVFFPLKPLLHAEGFSSHMLEGVYIHLKAHLEAAIETLSKTVCDIKD